VEDNMSNNNVEDNDDSVFMQPYGESSPRKVTILDMLNPSVPRVSREIRTDRLDICKQCPEYRANIQCSICNCMMPLKTWLKDAECPIGKWGHE